MAPLTTQDFVEIGERYATRKVLEAAQLGSHAARRDKDGLAQNGWPEKRTENLDALVARLLEANRAYEARFGYYAGNAEGVVELCTKGRCLRMRTAAIGRNALGSEGAVELERHLRPTSGKAARLGQQLGDLLAVARKHEALFRQNGADDVYFADMEATAAALLERSATGHHRKTDLPAEHDTLDELDGRIYLELKALNRAGRAFHLGQGDRRRAAEYVLDVLNRRAKRRADPEV